MSFTNYLEDKVLKHVFGGSAYTAPSTLYVGLFTAEPGEAGGGTEVSGNGYARQSVAMSVSGNSPTEADNDANIEFPAATGNQGTISHAGVFDAATGGNLLAYAAISDPTDLDTALTKTVTSGDVFRIAAGNLKIRLD
ncbi:MAG: hypothetical protein DWQ28_13085 [Proteobacteria bacterium]|nr:MAG: hypothetical protein DWQ28_13085 [Pseudomonadota bacterium]